MSRAYNARRKARRQAGAAAQQAGSGRSTSFRRRLAVVAPVLIIAAIFALVGVVGFGIGAGTSKEQIEQEVTELLAGIPQEQAVLGSPSAPVTLWVYADLECPTVKLFVEHSLPSIVDTWVRTGAVKLHYRSLQTDTKNERVFFEQETAALAAGRQGRMWNYLLTFVRQQGQPHTDYADEEFFAGIAAQVPALELARWDRERVDAELSRQVARGVYTGHRSGLRSTPSFRIGFSTGDVDRRAERVAIREEVKTSLGGHIEFLRKEAAGDFPTIRAAGPGETGG